MKIGDKIRIFRIQKGYSQENMSQMLGISLNAYSKIERGETDPGFSRLEQIAEVLETTIMEILAHGEKNINYVQNCLNGVVVSAYIINQNHDIDSLNERLQILEDRLKNKGIIQ